MRARRSIRASAMRRSVDLHSLPTFYGRIRCMVAALGEEYRGHGGPHGMMGPEGDNGGPHGMMGPDRDDD